MKNATWVRVRIVGILLLAAVPARLLARQEEKPARPKELDLLDRFTGTWDIQSTTKLAQAGSQEVRERGVNEVEWSLDRSFLKTRSMDAQGKETALQMFTWNPAAREYRHWYFGVGGMTSEGKGGWDEATQTLTLKGDLPEGRTVHFKGRLVKDGVYETQFEVKGKSGELLLEVRGNWVRR